MLVRQQQSPTFVHSQGIHPKTAEQLSLKALLLVIGFLTHFRACNFEGVQLVE
jgi:hypothetical protein